MFSTGAATVGQVLKLSHVTLAKGDLVEPTENTPLTKGLFNINVYRARPVLVIDGTKSYRMMSAYQSPRLLAKAAGVNVYPEDAFKTGIVQDFVQDKAIGEQITVIPAVPFTVHVDGTTRALRTQAKTVGGALAGAGIALGPKDTVSTPTSAPLVADSLLTVTRVTEAVVTQTQDLPKPVQNVNDPNLMQGQTQVSAPGQDGSKVATYMVHYQDGVPTSQTLLQVISDTPPVPEVVQVGTEVLFEGSVMYWRPQVLAAAAQYGVDPNVMLSIMECESNGNAADVSQFVVDGQHPEGLFQYLMTTWEAAGGTPGNIFNGSVQIQLTAKKIAHDGTGAWACQ